MRTFLLSAVFTALVSLTAHAAPPSVVVLRVYVHSTITVTRGAGKTETIKSKSALASNRNAQVKQFQTVLAGLYEEGYAIQSTAVANAGVEVASSVVTYVLVKP